MGADPLRNHLELLILGTLKTTEAHGYGVLQQIRDRSGGTFDYAEGTIYPALHRLEQAGLVASRWSDESGRRRRVYRLSAGGRRALVAHLHRWLTVSAATTAILGSPS